MALFSNLKDKIMIGMVHVGALPGTPNHTMPIQAIIDTAVKEANLLQKCGFDAIIIENMHDVPYLNTDIGPEITASMTVIACGIKREIQIPCGIQILAGANCEAIAVAQAANLDFIRAEGFVFAHVADEGFFQSQAGKLLRYRKMIGAEDIEIFVDVMKKHSSHAITGDISLEDHIKAADFFRCDGMIITGAATGKSTDIHDLEKAIKVTKKPVVVGSGITAGNLNDYWLLAHGFIVGSYLKENGYWENPIHRPSVEKLMDRVGELRAQHD